MISCADDVVVACPLFQAEWGGSIPTSAHELIVKRCSERLFRDLNARWHSRLPRAGGFYTNGLFFVAECRNAYYATAGWSAPVARMLATHGDVLELRRFAIARSAPKHSASRLLAVMVRLIARERPTVHRLVSYQDTEVHTGTIYKAQGWTPVNVSGDGDEGWITRHPRRARDHQTLAPKVRWERVL